MPNTVELTQEEIKNLREIRNYFGENDRTMFQHKAFVVLDRVIRKTENLKPKSGNRKQEV